jgi:hypothetical protein
MVPRSQCHILLVLALAPKGRLSYEKKLKAKDNNMTEQTILDKPLAKAVDNKLQKCHNLTTKTVNVR